jgi:hypothetical protein
MQAYKFDTKISKNGIISLPQTRPDLYGKEVELFIIIPKEEKSVRKEKANASEFVTRWAGVFENENFNIENAKYEYLLEKYK